MKKIHLNRDRQNLGEFSPEEVLAGLADGRFLPTDLAWYVGLDAWRPLGELKTSLETDTPFSPVQTQEPLPTSGSPVAAAALGAAGFSALSDTHGAPPLPAWEERTKLGFLPALIESIRQILTKPGETFSRMPREGGYTSPLIFSILLSWLGFIGASIYQGIWIMVNPEAMQQELQGVSMGFFWIALVGVLLFMPVVLAAGAFIGAGIVHLCLMLTGGAKHSFETTFRVLCYSQGATGILQLIPICGGLIYTVWYLVAAIIGLIKAHETEAWRVVVAVLLPAMLCCGLIIGLISFGAAAGVAAAAGK